MTEQLVNHPSRLEFNTVLPRDCIAITTGHDDQAWQYNFTVNEINHWPSGSLTAKNPEGEILGEVPMQLHGCGRWTTPRENPVQSQPGKAFTPYYDGLIVGSFLFGKFEGQKDRAVFDRPGQAISAIGHTPYRENALLTILSDHEEPQSVKSISKAIEERGDVFAERDIRTVLRNLIKTGHVSLLSKKVQLFEISR